MKKSDFFKTNPVGDLLEELNEQDMRKVIGGTWYTSAESRKYCKTATLGSYGAFCSISAECNAGSGSC